MIDSGGNATENWDKINAVQRMQDYIELHLSEPITLRMISTTAGYSPWHSTRIFKELVGKTPFEYIRNLRLSRAATMLSETNAKIIDVALDFEFSTHEGFTRAFSRQFGIKPYYYRKNNPPIKIFIPESIRERYLNLLKGEIQMSESTNTDTVFVQVIERPKRKLILKRGIKASDYYEYCQEEGCDDVWNTLIEIKQALYEPMGVWLPANMKKPGTSTYAQGVEVPVEYEEDIPEGFDIIELQPCKMMIFQGQPYDDKEFEQAISSLWAVMKNYNPELYGFEWTDEDAPRFQYEPQGYRGYIEGRPVKQVNLKEK
ncbi:helix-turn-helix domain-containing protein [Chloroflexota bacterium]